MVILSKCRTPLPKGPRWGKDGIKYKIIFGETAQGKFLAY